MLVAAVVVVVEVVSDKLCTTWEDEVWGGNYFATNERKSRNTWAVGSKVNYDIWEVQSWSELKIRVGLQLNYAETYSTVSRAYFAMQELRIEVMKTWYTYGNRAGPDSKVLVSTSTWQ